MDAEPDEVLLLDTGAAVALVVEDHEGHAATLGAVAWASRATPGSRPTRS